MPRVTVLLPAGDRVDAAVATACDLLDQSMAELEVLLLVGGQCPVPAGSAEDGRVRVVPARKATGDALNDGLALAGGEFVARASPGDRSDPGRLARQVELITASDLAFVGTGWRAIAADGRVVEAASPPPGDAALRAALADGDAIGHPTALMRRDAVERAGGWRPAFVGREDYDLLLRLLDRQAGACTPEPLVEHQPSDAAAPWRTLEQRILSELAAVAAHDRRQAGRPDEGGGAAPADRALLHRMGVADEEITRALCARALALATTAGTQRRWRAMREAARLGLHQKALPEAARLQFTMLWLRSLARRSVPTILHPTA